MSRYVEVPVVSHLDAIAHVDTVSIEEPLEIWISCNDHEDREVKLSLSITMRTPGEDEDLVIGFLFSEGIISCINDVERIGAFGPFTEPHNLQNQIKVKLKSGELSSQYQIGMSTIEGSQTFYEFLDEGHTSRRLGYPAIQMIEALSLVK